MDVIGLATTLLVDPQCTVHLKHPTVYFVLTPDNFTQKGRMVDVNRLITSAKQVLFLFIFVCLFANLNMYINNITLLRLLQGKFCNGKKNSALGTALKFTKNLEISIFNENEIFKTD